MPKKFRENAYDDIPLPIGHEQTISQPYTVAAMTEDLEVREGHKVLEIGAGSGYQAAILAEVTGKSGSVTTVERIRELASMAKENLEAAGLGNVTVVNADGTLGYPKKAPYDRILVAADSPSIPNPLKEQLKKGGKMIIPVKGAMTLAQKGVVFRQKKLGIYAFVPLIGEHGFKK